MLKDARAKLNVTGAVDKKSSGGVEECFFLEYADWGSLNTVLIDQMSLEIKPDF